MTIKIVGVNSLIIYFENKIDEGVAKRVKSAYFSLKNLNIDGVVEIIPSYTSIFISYDIFKYDFYALKTLIEKNINLDFKTTFEEKIITIDVYYGLDVGFDLQKISEEKKLSINEIIKIHSNKLYDVYTIGFLPAFAYLAFVDERISTPRLQTPRKNVPKGSVAMANNQTAIYPQNSPGGWNIIGKTATELFDKSKQSLSLINMGDKVKFNPISKEEFLSQGGII